MHGNMNVKLEDILISAVFVYVFGPMYISTCDSMNGRYWERKTCIMSVQ
jgi:hypothetical protein